MVNKLLTCKLLTMYSYSVRLSRYDLLTRGSVIIFSIPGLLPLYGITNSYDTVIQISTFCLHFKCMEQFHIIPAYLKSAFGTQRNYSIDFSGISIIFELRMKTMDIHKNR